MKIISNLLLLATLIFSSLVASGSHSAEKKHIVAIDAGSTGSRVYIYEYTTPRGQLIPTIHLAEDITNDPATAWVKKIKPGVSSFADNTSEIEPYITQFTNYISQKIPSTIDKATVPVIFQASAGMRVLEKSTQDNIVKKIKLTLASNGFSKNLVEVITGQDEGIYGWLGINYLLGNLTKERRQLTAGILDMGGSSFQVAFEPRASYTPTTDGHIKDIAIGHHHYNIYSVSYSGYGEISARKKWTAPVCELSDTSAPSNFQDCKRTS